MVACCHLGHRTRIVLADTVNPRILLSFIKSNYYKKDKSILGSEFYPGIRKFRGFTIVALLKVIEVYALTQIQGCFRASSERILLDGLTVNIWFIRFLASGVTVSHSGEGYCKMKLKLIPAPLSKQCVNRNYTLWK